MDWSQIVLQLEAFPSVVIGNFKLVDTGSSPCETNLPLLIDPDTVLTSPIPFQHRGALHLT